MQQIIKSYKKFLLIIKKFKLKKNLLFYVICSIIDTKNLILILLISKINWTRRL